MRPDRPAYRDPDPLRGLEAFPREAIERELESAPEEIRAAYRWLPIGTPTDVAV
jgi:hypothetical protein